MNLVTGVIVDKVGDWTEAQKPECMCPYIPLCPYSFPLQAKLCVFNRLHRLGYCFKLFGAIGLVLKGG